MKPAEGKMHISLKRAVTTRHPNGHFEQIPQGKMVNYSWKRRDGSTVHKFSCFDSKGSSIIEHIEVIQGEENPPWL